MVEAGVRSSHQPALRCAATREHMPSRARRTHVGGFPAALVVSRNWARAPCLYVLVGYSLNLPESDSQTLRHASFDRLQRSCVRTICRTFLLDCLVRANIT